jgi:hypothetical protein
MKKQILAVFVFLAIFSSENARAETRLIVSYDEAYQGNVSVNGQEIGTLISHATYNEISEMVKAAKARGEKLDKDLLYQEKTKADEAGLQGIGSNLIMNFEVGYNLDKFLRSGENKIAITFSSYTNPEAEKFAYKGRGIKGPNKLEAEIWEVTGDNADLLDYKTNIAKPTPGSRFGTDLASGPQTIEFVITK